MTLTGHVRFGGGPSGKGPARLEPRPAAYPAIVADAGILAELDLPDDETVVEVPARLMIHLTKDGMNGEVGNLVPPIVHVKEDGNYIVKGRRITDPEALGAMNIPDHETCVEVSKSAMLTLLVGR